MIYLTPEGGLCNRMRSIASVWHLAKIAQQPMTVHWWLTDDMNCAFTQLFDMASLPFTVRERNAVGWRKALFKVGVPSFERLHQWTGSAVLSPEVSARLVNQETALRDWAGTGNPRIRTNSKVLDAPQIFDIFRPAKHVQDAVDRYAPTLQHSVGVHIRRGDNTKSSAFSSTQSFIKAMHLELEKVPQTQFFVATDSPETFATLQAEFGNAVYQHEKQALRRDLASAIQDALVDLYCLAACRKLIGSYWSSFSDTAWEIHGIDHHIVQDQARAA